MSYPTFNLFEAIGNNDIHKLQSALSAGASPDSVVSELLGERLCIGDIGLSAAAYAGFLDHIESLEILLSAGANVNLVMKRDLNGTSALDHVATYRPDALRCLQLLLDNGAQFETVDGKGDTLLGRLCDLNNRLYHPAIKLLVGRGANLNAQDFEGRTPLMKLIDGFSDSEILTFLLESGADANIATYTGENAIEWAKRHKNTDAIQLIGNFLDNQVLTKVIHTDRNIGNQGFGF